MEEISLNGVTKVDEVEPDNVPRVKVTPYMVVKTTFMVLAPAVMGIYLELSGPTLPDLMTNVQSNYEEISRALVVRSIGYFVSSLVAGILAEQYTGSEELMISLALFLGALGTALAPWAKRLWLLCIGFHLQGLGEGALDTFNNVLCMKMWQAQSAAPVHALHFGFGVGAFLAPQLARPYISDKNTLPEANGSIILLTNDSESGNYKIHDATTVGLDFSSSDIYAPAVSSAPIEIPYTISAVLTGVISLAFLGFYIHERKIKATKYYLRKPITDNGESNCSEVTKNFCKQFSPGSCTSVDTSFGIKYFILIFIFYMCVVGGERAYGKFIYSYAVEGDPSFSSDEAANLNSVFWISFTVGRGLAIIVAKWVKPSIMVLTEVAANLLCGVVLSIWAYDIPMVLWVFSGLFGVFLSPVFPAGLALANRYVIMNGPAVAMVFIGSATGGMVFQWVTGYLFEYQGPETLMFVILGYAILLTIIVVLKFVLLRKRPERFTKYEPAEMDEPSK